MKTLIVCDLQPEVVQKLPHPRQFVDLVSIAVQAARPSASNKNNHHDPRSMNIIYTMLKFDEPGYTQIPPSHPRLGILRRLYEKNPNLKWFTSSDLSVSVSPKEEEKANDDHRQETVVTRSTFLPHANDTKLLEILRSCCCATQTTAAPQNHDGVTVIGYGPTVQAVCHLLGDVLAVPNVQILRECVRDEKEDRCRAFLDHGLLFQEQAVSLVDFLEAQDRLHERICINDDNTTTSRQPTTIPPDVKYVSDCGRGGHISLFMPYLLRDHGYTPWPTQPWYKELTLASNSKEYNCPLGKRMVHLCDEPQFSQGTKFFLAGRQFLDEKNLLHDLVPELMPPTFESIEVAQEYAATILTNDETTKLVWFLKKVNQNGGRAVIVTNELPTEPLQEDEQLQVHIPRPLLYHEHRPQQPPQQQEVRKYKCHVKTYQFISCTTAGNGASTTWQLYMHDLFYLSTASKTWSPDDISDDAQITTMRTHRLYPDNAWRLKWNLTEMCRTNMQTVMQRAVGQGKLQQHSHPSAQDESIMQQSTHRGNDNNPGAALQFEINSADWMLDEDGRMYLIECNGIPVLYDPLAGDVAGKPQDLVTKGLKLYDRLYKEDPETAVVNDHDLLKEAIGLALTGKLPKKSLWQHVASIPSPS